MYQYIGPFAVSVRCHFQLFLELSINFKQIVFPRYHKGNVEIVIIIITTTTTVSQYHSIWASAVVGTL